MLWLAAGLAGWLAASTLSMAGGFDGNDHPITLHVWQESPSPTPPYASWETAAHTIQEAVDAALPNDRVLVTNGVYATGGIAVVAAMTNRAAISKAIVVQSVNGPAETVIEGAPAPGAWPGLGDGAVRCAYVGTNAMLSGFTLANGCAGEGGGVWCEFSGVVTNCVLAGNSAHAGGGAWGGTLYDCTLAGNSSYGSGGGAAGGTLYRCTLAYNWAEGWDSRGGGASGATLYSCTLTDNQAAWRGGGASEGTLYNCALTGNVAGEGGGTCSSTLYNCTMTDNLAGEGGGACSSTLYNCIVCLNTAADNPNHSRSTLHFSCTTPLPTGGTGNIETDPEFVDPAAGDFHLRAGSPCIDAGTDLADLLTTDLDGNPRPADGNGDTIAAFDMGAYEYLPIGCFGFEQGEYLVVENETQAALEVLRPGLDGLEKILTVDYAVSGGTATPGADYTPVSGTLTFDAGVTNQPILVPLFNDALREPDETILLVLSNPTGGASLGSPITATIRIRDNDRGVTLATNQVALSEDQPSVTLTVRRGDDLGAAFTVDYAAARVGTDPSLLGRYDTDGEVWGVKLVGNYAYLADGVNGLKVVDLSNPARPVLLGTCDTPGTARAIDLVGDYAYVADGTAGLQVIEVWDPIRPIRVGGSDIGGVAEAVQVVGPYAYVAGQRAGLQILDVSDPVHPLRVGGYDPPRAVHDVVVTGHYAYLANDWDGLLILDVTDPTRPVPVGNCDTGGNACGVEVVGDHVYVATTVKPATVERVIEISVDGLRGDLLEQLIVNEPWRYPNFYRLKTEGACTFNARTDYNITETTPNHVTIVTARPVLQQPGWPPTLHHGVTDNGSVNLIIHTFNPAAGYVPGVFDVVHDHGLSTAVYVGKTKLSIFDRSYNEVNGAPDLIGVDNGRDKVDTAYTVGSTPAIVNALVQEVPRHFTFIHMTEPDSAGHGSGWGSPAWNETVAGIDANLGIIFNLIETNAAYQGKTAILLTADHGGGSGGGHGTPSSPENHTIPFLVWGAGMPPGSDLYDQFPNRFDPGTGWPDYNAPEQPLRNGDVSNVALSVLGLDPIPGSPLVPVRTTTPSGETNEATAIAVIDVRDPAHPARVGGFATGNAVGIDVEGPLAYVADGLQGLQVFDVSNPEQPGPVSGYDTAGDTQEVDAAGRYVCVADRKGGLLVFGRGAQADRDFMPTSGTLEFAAGETEMQIVVPLLNDALREGEESFLLTLTNPSTGVSLGSPATATIRIQDNDPGIAFATNTLLVVENQPGVNCTVRRGSDAIDTAFTVDYGISAGTATAGTDYKAISGTLEFAAGETERQIMVPLLNDALREREEMFLLTLSNPSTGVSLGSAPTATIRIQDNDVGVAFVTTDITVLENQPYATCAVRRGEELGLALALRYAARGGSATAGADFTAVSGTLEFAAGEAEKQIRVPLLNDGLREAAETILLTLTDPAGGISLDLPCTATIRIQDNDPGVSFAVSEVTVAEQQPAVALMVRREDDVGMPFTVDYALVGSQIIPLGGYDTDGEVWDVVVAGNYAYLANGVNGLKVVDLSNPAQPLLLGTCDTPGTALAVDVLGDYAYVADGTAGLQVIDVRDPAQPVLHSTRHTGGVAEDIQVVGNYAYVADRDSGLQIIDVRDPAHLLWVGGYTSTAAHDVCVAGHYAYLANDFAGLLVLDVADPSRPALVGSCDTSGIAFGLQVVGDYAYVADYSSLQVIEVSDPAHPIPAGSCRTRTAFRVLVSGPFAYVAQGVSGLQVIDVSDPAQPTAVNSYDTAGFAYDLDLAGPYLYVADRSGGLPVFSRTATASPDLAAVSGTLEFGAGETEKPILLPLLHDGVWEPEKLCLVALSNPTGGVSLGSPTTALIRIVEANLQILGPPEAGQLRLRLRGPAGWTCQIEQSPDLVQWHKVAEVTTTGSPQEIVVPLPPGQNAAFHRAVMR